MELVSWLLDHGAILIPIPVTYSNGRLYERDVRCCPARTYRSCYVVDLPWRTRLWKGSGVLSAVVG